MALTQYGHYSKAIPAVSLTHSATLLYLPDKIYEECKLLSDTILRVRRPIQEPTDEMVEMLDRCVHTVELKFKKGMTVTEMITDFCTALPPEKRGRFDKGEYILQNIQVLPYSHIQLSSQQTRLIIDICVLSLHPLSQPRPQRHSEPIRIRLFNIHCWIFMSSMCNSRGVGLDRGSSVVKRWACKHENPSFNPGHVSSSDESKLKINSL